jgi:hypothetical protein
MNPEVAGLQAEIRRLKAENAQLREMTDFQNIQHALEETVGLFNYVAEIARDSGILRGRELAKLTTQASESIKAAESPTEKFLLLIAFIRQLLTRIKDGLKSRTQSGKVVQVVSKIMARAVQIIDYIKTYEDDPMGRRDISLDSQQARLLFSGRGEPQVSRRDTIRAMRRAEALWPSLRCGHRPGDGRQTMRLTISREDLSLPPSYGDLWQRSGPSIALGL